MEAINKFKQLIQNKKYYEAHEALEELWFPIRKTKTNYCLILKGFINGAVSLELLKRDKIVQSKKVYKTYLKHTNETKFVSIENLYKLEELKELKEFMTIEFKKVGYSL